jgi:hypothetical protein
MRIRFNRPPCRASEVAIRYWLTLPAPLLHRARQRCFASRASGFKPRSQTSGLGRHHTIEQTFGIVSRPVRP